MNNKIQPAYLNPNFRKERPQKIIDLSIFLGSCLNQLHNLNFSDRYWLTLLKPYLTFCINIEPYLSQENIKWNIPVFAINKWEPLSKKDCLKSELIRKLKESKLKTSLKQFSEDINQFDNIVYGPRSASISKAINGKILIPPGLVFLWRKNNEKRKKLNNIATQQKSFFKKNVLLNVPKAYVEYYDYINGFVTNINEPSKKIFHREHGAGTMFGFLVAKNVEFGAKVYEYQLGAYIGETNESISDFKYLTIDKHLTYGWKHHEKDEPFYAVRLEEFKEKYQLVNNEYSRDITIVYNSVSDYNKNRYTRLTKYLSENLIQNKYYKIHLRPRGITKKYSNKKELFFLKHLKKFKIDSGTEPIFKIVKSSRIILHWDIPSTNFLECIYVDHPVIGLLTNDEPTEIIKPYYDFFLKEGVLHLEINTLVDHLNNCEIDNWWKEVVQSSTYKAFKNNFARSPQTLSK